MPQQDLDTTAPFRTIFEFAPVAVARLDLTGRVLEANPALQRISGYALGEIHGRSFAQFIAPEDYSAAATDFARLARGECEYYETERRYRLKSGDFIWAHSSAALVRGESGRPLYCIAVLQDISERKERETERAELLAREQEARRAAEAAEQRYRFLSEAMPQLVWTATPDGLLDYANQRWNEYTGIPPKQAQGTGWIEAVHPDDRPDAVEAWQHARESGEEYEVTCRLRRTGNGDYRWFLCRALPVRDARGAIVKWFGTSTDIDEQKRAEEDAQYANRIKDEFLATLSHELRTPLNAILGWTTLLQTGKLDIEAATRAVETIRRSAKTQARLVEDLLDMSRIVSGKLRLELKPVELGPIVEAALDTVKPSADSRQVDLEVDLEPRPCLVWGDANRLQQIVWNLMTNAIKFTPRNGRVVVRLARRDGQAELIVSDTGQGITAEFLPYVFERFRQSDSSATRKQGGVGLGLAIVRHLTELHGGAVAAESGGEGKGATFRVFLPLMKGIAELEQRADLAVVRDQGLPDLTGVRILIVDDHQDARELLTTVLTRAGAVVTALGSAEEALQFCEHQRPDLLISDIEMPGEDGYSLIRRLRALWQGQPRVPAIALTAYARAEDRVRALMAGFQMHIAKPIEAMELAAVVASLTGRTDQEIKD